MGGHPLEPTTSLRVQRALNQLVSHYERIVLPGEVFDLHFSHEQPTIQSLRHLGAISGMDFEIGQVLGFWAEKPPLVDLYPFQKEGVDWLINVGRGILADDMGLGKTVQAIVAAQKLLWSNAAVNVLVVAPRSLVYNWYSEFRKWAPKLTVSLVFPSGAGAIETWARRLGRATVILTTYEQIRMNSEILSGKFDLVIADEAHRLRNAKSGLSRSFQNLESEHLWLLTGTPLERDVDDLLTLLSILQPGKFSVRDRRLDEGLIRAQSRPYVLRRRKSDVLGDLPEMTHVHEFLELSDTQKSEYREALAWTKEQNALQRFSKLRAICDLASNGTSSSKLDRIVEIIMTIQGLGESTVVFSFWDAPMEELARRLSGVPGLKTVTYNSKLSLTARNDAVEEFKSSGGIFLASGHIASEGLTLVEANHVIFVNRWWNPSLNRQAADRIRRIGQQKPTFMYSFTAPQTVEAAIDQMLNEKSDDEHKFVELLVAELEKEGDDITLG